MSYVCLFSSSSMFGVHLFLFYYYSIQLLISNFVLKKIEGGGPTFCFISCFFFIKLIKAGELQFKKCPIGHIVLSIICNFNPNTFGVFSHYREKKCYILIYIYMNIIQKSMYFSAKIVILCQAKPGCRVQISFECARNACGHFFGKMFTFLWDTMDFHKL